MAPLRSPHQLCSSQSLIPSSTSRSLVSEEVLATTEILALKQAIEHLNVTLEKQGRVPDLLDEEIKKSAKASTTKFKATRHYKS
ncbi:hypothetical protein Slin14017_G091110 [Septoria linicola]|nr:hypothetical protein Slin14017_G091110 [Septoria linicola]